MSDAVTFTDVTRICQGRRNLVRFGLYVDQIVFLFYFLIIIYIYKKYYSSYTIVIGYFIYYCAKSSKHGGLITYIHKDYKFKLNSDFDDHSEVEHKTNTSKLSS